MCQLALTIVHIDVFRVAVMIMIFNIIVNSLKFERLVLLLLRQIDILIDRITFIIVFLFIILVVARFTIIIFCRLYNGRMS
jgi:hypothetical protein